MIQTTVATKRRTSSNLLEEEEEGHIVVAKKEIESNSANVEEDNKDENKEGSNVKGRGRKQCCQ